MKNRTDNISKSVIKDALNVCGGINSMNAKGSTGYAFTCRDDGRAVNCGEFMYSGEAVTSERFTGFIDFKDGVLTDLESGEELPLIA